MSLEDDHKNSPSEFYPRGPILWARITGWAFVIVPWLVLVVFHPLQDARMFWTVMTRPAEAGTTIAGWLGESYGHVLPILPWPQAQSQANQTRRVLQRNAVAPAGTHRGISHKVSDTPIR